MNCGDYAKIIEYNKYKDIVVEFIDNHNAQVNTTYYNFINGQVKNPYHPSVHGVGMIGTKYKISSNRIETKEYIAWYNMLKRCFSNEYKEKHPTYLNTICCEEWLYYENFYEWLHSQDNFDKWLSNKRWDIDKDIIKKGNNIYCEDVCCLIPNSINKLFTRTDAKRGHLPIGVSKQGNMYQASCGDIFSNKRVYLGVYKTAEDAFIAYKEYKEQIIKRIAEIEYANGNIIDKCYNAMMKYVVDIDD